MQFLMLKPPFFTLFIVLLFNLVFSSDTIAQCTFTVATFPYLENFENSEGNWFVNGSAPDWAWGAPTKPVINKAASGSNCWVTGGLTGSFYNNGEASWLQSPCFDFSVLQYPYLSFNVWWETENGYDGASLQYSVDGGISWKNLGSSSETANCLNTNWFNSQRVSFLSSFSSSPEGWSGSVQNPGGGCRSGGGSGGWVVASHILTNLAGEKNVIFRFTFAAGTQCNNYDGFAIDDFSIEEAPPNNGRIDYSCADSNTVDFGFSTDLCPTSYEWNFDDLASDQNNSSTNPTPTHVFSSPGTYNVSLKVSSDGNAPFTTNQQITILGLNTQVISPISCSGGSTGAIKVNVTGGAGPFSYSWNSVPVQTGNTANNLVPGTYKVDVSSAGACPVSASVTLENPVIKVDSSIQQPGCLFEKGSINLNISGGIPPYNFSWSPAVSTGPVAENLLPGNYSLNISDSRPCNLQLNFIIATLPSPQISLSGITDADCNGLKLGSAHAFASDGTAPYTFSWNTFPAQINDSAVNLKKGDYSVTITDANGCTDTKFFTIGVGGICNDIYFPDAITPDGNNINDLFGPLGNVIEMSRYVLLIYNRYGQLVFSSNNPLVRWDGTFKGAKAVSGAYVWYSNYLYQNKFKKSQKGTLLLIR